MRELRLVLLAVPVVLIVLALLMWFAGVQTEWQERTGGKYVYPYRALAFVLTFVAAFVAMVDVWLWYDGSRGGPAKARPPMPRGPSLP